MSSIKKQYQVFIDEMIKHGDNIRAYKTAYPKSKDEVARVNSYRLLQNATIANAIQEKADEIRTIATQEAIKELKDEIKAEVLTAMQKREILFKIANGQVEVETKKPVWNSDAKKFQFVTVTEMPDFIARMKAIDLDNKMAGDYAAVKITTPPDQPFETKMIIEIVTNDE
jgi:hypothetical protein